MDYFYKSIHTFIYNIFCVVFELFELYRKHLCFRNSKMSILYSGIFFSVLVFIIPIFINIIEYTVLGRISRYFIGNAEVSLRTIFAVLMGTFLLLFVHFFFKSDEINYFFLFNLLIVFGFVLAFPGAVALYGRFLMFIAPFLGFYIYRSIRLNLASIYQIPFIMLVFISGVIRVYLPTLDGIGVAKYLAFGHAFDPLMGTLKMLSDFL